MSATVTNTTSAAFTAEKVPKVDKDVQALAAPLDPPLPAGGGSSVASEPLSAVPTAATVVTATNEEMSGEHEGAQTSAASLAPSLPTTGDSSIVSESLDSAVQEATTVVTITKTVKRTLSVDVVDE